MNNVKTSRSVYFQNVFISFSDAISKIFDTSKLDNTKGPQCWNLPFLICYKKLAIEEHFKEQLDAALLKYAINNIEYIHEAGARYRFFKQTDHNYLKVCSYPILCNDKFSVAVAKKSSKAKVPKAKYCQLELNMLCIGLNYFRNRHHAYKKMASSKHLGFSKQYPSSSERKPRTNQQLTTLRSKLQLNGELKTDPATQRIYHLNSTVEECSPVTGICYSEAEDELKELYLETRATSNCKLFNDSINEDQRQTEESNKKWEEFVELIDGPKRVKMHDEDENSNPLAETDTLNVCLIETDQERINKLNLEDIRDNLNENSLDKLKRINTGVGIKNLQHHVKVINKLPHIDSKVLSSSWGTIYKTSLGSTLRDFKKWNELKEILIVEKLLEMRIIECNNKKFTRYYRLFRTLADQ